MPNYFGVLANGRRKDFIFATLVMAFTSLIAVVVGQVLVPHNVLLVFFIGVLAVAVKTSVFPALWSAVFGFLAYNFFFTEPHHTFKIMHRDDLLTAIFFLLLSSVTGKLAAQLRHHILALEMSGQQIQDLLTLSHQLASAIDSAHIEEIAVKFAHNSFGVDVVLLRKADDAEVYVAASAGRMPGVSPEDLATARRVWNSTDASELTVAGQFIFLRLASAQKTLALIVIAAAKDTSVKEELSYPLSGACQQIAQALERADLVRELEETKLRQETEQLRTALLASVSHDLKTPLSAMIGATSSVLQYDDRLTPEERRELLDTTLQEAERLSRYIQNLLDMVKLGYGELKLDRDWVMVSDIVASAINRLEYVLSRCSVQVELPLDLPLIYVHGALIEQAVVNILENAARFSKPGDTLKIVGRRQEDALILDVIDQGPGIPIAERSKVFDMFYSMVKGDRQQGTGLGLSICNGMVSAHGGKVEALAGDNGKGTCIRIILPLHDQPDFLDEKLDEKPDDPEK